MADTVLMILIHCPHCETNHLVGYRSLVEVQNTEYGPVAFAHCPHGHLGFSPRPAERHAAV